MTLDVRVHTVFIDGNLNDSVVELMNIDVIAHGLRQSLNTMAAYFSDHFTTPCNVIENTTIYIKGNIRRDDIQLAIKQFIRTFVQCQRCQHMELVVFVIESKQKMYRRRKQMSTSTPNQCTFGRFPIVRCNNCPYWSRIYETKYKTLRQYHLKKWENVHCCIVPSDTPIGATIKNKTLFLQRLMQNYWESKTVLTTQIQKCEFIECPTNNWIVSFIYGFAYDLVKTWTHNNIDNKLALISIIFEQVFRSINVKPFRNVLNDLYELIILDDASISLWLTQYNKRMDLFE